MVLPNGKRDRPFLKSKSLIDSSLKRGRCILSTLAVLFFLLGAGKSAADSIKISWDPVQVRSGGVVLLEVRSPVNLRAAEAATGKDRFPLLKEEDGTYRALVGIDQKFQGPTVPVDFVFFLSKGGPPYRIRADLKVMNELSVPVSVQRLSLPTGMVDLTGKRVSQVKRDNRSLGDALGLRSRQRYWDRGFILPVRGRITTRFGTKRILNGKPRSSHNGVDIAAKRGTAVKAANSGIIRLADDFLLSGNTVVVDHGWGVSTIYAHLDQIAVGEGQRVVRGQTIGTVGKTGRVTGPHLHFGAFIRGARIDPLRLIEATEKIKAVDSDYRIQNPENDPG